MAYHADDLEVSGVRQDEGINSIENVWKHGIDWTESSVGSHILQCCFELAWRESCDSFDDPNRFRFEGREVRTKIIQAG